MITEQTRIILTKKLDVSDLAGEKVMADFETGKYYMLKGAANDIWEHIQSDITVGELKDRLLRIYDVDEATCLQGIVTFLEQLHQNGFLSLQ